MPDISNDVGVKPRYTEGRSGVRSWWTDPDTFATTLFVLFADAIADDKQDDDIAKMLFFDPETIIHEVQSEFEVEPHPVCRDKLLSAVAIVSTDLFETDENAFIQICNVLSGDTFEPDEFDPADGLECAWGISEATLLLSPGNGRIPFRPKVASYVAHVCQWEGIFPPPRILELGQTLPFEFPYPEDIELAQLAAQSGADRGREIEYEVRLRMQKLFRQLSSLELRFGTTASLTAMAARHFK